MSGLFCFFVCFFLVNLTQARVSGEENTDWEVGSISLPVDRSVGHRLD